jgi:hypothetical protein
MRDRSYPMTDNALLSLIEGLWTTSVSRTQNLYLYDHSSVGGRRCFLATAWRAAEEYGHLIPADQWDRVARMAASKKTLYLRFDGKNKPQPLGWLTGRERQILARALEKARKRKLRALREQTPRDQETPDLTSSEVKLTDQERIQIAEGLIGAGAWEFMFE